MKVLVGGAAALVLAVLAGPVVAGGMDVPETDAPVVSEGDAGGDPVADADPQEGTDGSLPDDTETGDSPSDDQPSYGVTGTPDGDGSDASDGSDSEVVEDDASGDGTDGEVVEEDASGDSSDSEVVEDDASGDGTDGEVVDDTETGDSPSDDHPPHGVTSGGISDEIDTNLVTDVGVFLPGGNAYLPVDGVPTGPTEDDTPVMTITVTSVPQAEPGMTAETADIVPIPTSSAPQNAPGSMPDGNATEIGALSTQDDDGTQCHYVPDRRAILCD